MSKLLKYFFLLFFYSITINSRVHSQEVNTLLKAVKDKLNVVKDYAADGIMKLNVPFLQVPDSKISVFYKFPDKFRIHQEKGISLVPKGGISINLSSLLKDENFAAVDAGSTTLNGIQTRVVKLLPLDEKAEVVLSTLYIDPIRNLILKTSTTTKENGSYEMEFTYGNYSNWGLPDVVIFSFNTKDYKLPKGVTFDYDEEEKPGPAQLKNSKGRVQVTYSSYRINKGVDEKVFK